MKARIAIYTLLILAYTLSLTHSFIPHHHHKTVDEARLHDKEHELEHERDHHHSHSGNDQSATHDHEDTSDHKHSDHGLAHLFFLSHDSSTEVNVRNESYTKSIKTMKIQQPAFSEYHFNSFSILKNQIFRPPQNENNDSAPTLLSNSLRAPPTQLV